MKELAAFVERSNVDLGAAMNVDGDRVAFVTSEGFPLSEEYTLPLAARSRLSRRAGPIVTNLSTSRMIDVVAEGHGQRVVRTSVGESHVMDRGIEEEAVLAGEGSGGVGALPAATTFDALLTLSMVLEAMVSTGSSLAELVQRQPRFVMRKGEVACTPVKAYRIMDDFRAAYAAKAPDCTDGVRVDWEDAWMHVRASNTEPLARIIVEAESSARADALFAAAMERARHIAGAS
jgi:phosphomannomutase